MTGVTVPLVASVSSTRRAAASAVRRIVDRAAPIAVRWLRNRSGSASYQASSCTSAGNFDFRCAT